MAGRQILVMAKAPEAGRAKTRLCPPCSRRQAAAIAEAALTDTLETAAKCGEVVVALDGDVGTWLPPGVTVITQRGADFNARLANAWADFGRGGLQIGMDTPQMTASLLDDAFARLDTADAVLGPAADGGWWAIGLHEPAPGVFDGVPMSTGHTHSDQLARMTDLGLRTATLSTLVDLDHWPDALLIASLAPGTHTARVVREVRASSGRQHCTLV